MLFDEKPDNNDYKIMKREFEEKLKRLEIALTEATWFDIQENLIFQINKELKYKKTGKIASHCIFPVQYT